MLAPTLVLPREAIADLCAQYQVRQLLIFGSAIRDDFRPDSDIDLLVEFEPGANVGFLTLMRLQRELAALLQRPVDLVPKNGLHPRLRASVLASAQVLYAA